MGGFGSGNRRGQKPVRPVVEDFLSIDVLDFKKDGLLDPGTVFKVSYSANGSDILSLSVTVGPDSLCLQSNHAARQQEVQLIRTSCQYGGMRPWLLCGRCDSKRNALYLGPNGRWACRQCLGLAYRIQRLNPHERLTYTAAKIKRTKLHITPENVSHGLQRPSGMWKKSHANIVEQILTYEEKSNGIFKDYFDGILKKADEQKNNCRYR